MSGVDWFVTESGGVDWVVVVWLIAWAVGLGVTFYQEVWKGGKR